jgi:hypothetical protein
VTKQAQEKEKMVLIHKLQWLELHEILACLPHPKK